MSRKGAAGPSGFDGSTGLLDLGAGGGADLVDLDGEGFFHFAIGKKLYLVAATIEKTAFAEHGFDDGGPCLKMGIEITDIDDADHIAEVLVVETPFWKTAVKRHLTAFEPDTGSAAGTGLLALVPLAGGLAVAGAFAAPKALDAMLGTWIGSVFVKLHDVFLG